MFIVYFYFIFIFFRLTCDCGRVLVSEFSDCLRYAAAAALARARAESIGAMQQIEIFRLSLQNIQHVDS